MLKYFGSRCYPCHLTKLDNPTFRFGILITIFPCITFFLITMYLHFTSDLCCTLEVVFAKVHFLYFNWFNISMSGWRSTILCYSHLCCSLYIYFLSSSFIKLASVLGFISGISSVVCCKLKKWINKYWKE